MSHFGSVNSYDVDAPLPSIGTRWVWEIDTPAARALTEVIAVKWNGEEWWVETKTLLPDSFPATRATHLNDLGRFWEAVTVVGGALAGRIVVRRPDLAVEGQEASLGS